MKDRLEIKIFSIGKPLNIPSSRINAGQRAFYYRGVKVWNNLSKDLREITNTKVFERRLINELICNMN